MLTPADKVRTGGNDIIQVVITRNCDLFNCSNCTQLLPFRQDTREMSLECVEEALLSLQDWPGVISAFGGNPCTASRFPEIAALWERLVPQQSRRGLWTNNLGRHGELIKRVWWPHGRFNLNVHHEPGAAALMREHLPGIKIFGETGRDHHGVMLGHWRDWGHTEEQWVAARERCDINRNWSAAIYERDGRPHAYFCEVAGSLDGVRGENHGVLCEPGWWRWPMERYAHQVTNCCDRGCAVPLRLQGAEDRQDLYQISPGWERDLRPPAGKVSVVVTPDPPEGTHELTDYIGLRQPKSKK